MHLHSGLLYELYNFMNFWLSRAARAHGVPIEEWANELMCAVWLSPPKFFRNNIAEYFLKYLVMNINASK